MTEKKATTKKETKKPTAKKATTKETTKKVTEKITEKKTEKKTTAPKKAAPKKDTASMKTVQEYIDVINWKKWEAHNMDWLYIEVNAGDLLTEVENGANNIKTVCKAIMECMLEGDAYIVEPKEKNKIASSLTVRYYCDNLSPDRKKM